MLQFSLRKETSEVLRVLLDLLNGLEYGAVYKTAARCDLKIKAEALLSKLQAFDKPHPFSFGPGSLGMWENDPVQFARLLAEISAAGGLPPEVLEAVKASTDLSEASIEQLFRRAEGSFAYESANIGSASIEVLFDGTEVVLPKNLGCVQISIANGGLEAGNFDIARFNPHACALSLKFSDQGVCVELTSPAYGADDTDIAVGAEVELTYVQLAQMAVSHPV